MRAASFHRVALLVAAAATLHGLVYVPFVTPHVGTDSDTYIASAEALLDGGYSTPLRAGFYYVYPVGFFDITGVKFDDRSLFPMPERQAFRPPGYPLFLAAFGGGAPGQSQWLALVAQAVAFGASAFLLALTVRRWWGERLGLLAAAFYAVDPYSKHYVPLIMSEVPAALLAVATAYAFTRAWQSRSTAWWAATGGLAAGLTLVRAVFVIVLPLLLLASLIHRSRRPVRVRNAGAVVAAVSLLLVPWLGWTASATGRPLLANYGEGFNLLVAAHGEGRSRPFEAVTADRSFVRDFERPHALAPQPGRLRADPTAHPRYVREADALLRAAARAEYRRRLGEEPLQVAGETAYRMAFLWSASHDWYQPKHESLRYLLRAVDWLALLLAAAGVVLALRRGGPARAAALFLLLYTAVLGVHHVEARFAIPVRGLMLAFVALALAELAPAVRVLRRS